MLPQVLREVSRAADFWLREVRDEDQETPDLERHAELRPVWEAIHQVPSLPHGVELQKHSSERVQPEEKVGQEGVLYEPGRKPGLQAQFRGSEEEDQRRSVEHGDHRGQKRIREGELDKERGLLPFRRFQKC